MITLLKNATHISIGNLKKCPKIFLIKTSTRRAQFSKYVSSESAIGNRVNSIQSTDTIENDLLLKRYNNLVETNLLKRDEHQYKSVLKLNSFFNQLIAYEKKAVATNTPIFSLFNSFLSRYTTKNNAELPKPDLKGIYLYGGVGG
jgi:predicted ATPase